MKAILVLLVMVILLCLSVSANAQSTLALQEKCAEGAKRWLEAHNPEGIIEHNNHYSKRLDKCFIRVDYFFYGSDTAVEVYDVFEWRSIGSFYQRKDGTLVRCYFGNNNCVSRTEFEALIKPYMEE